MIIDIAFLITMILAVFKGYTKGFIVGIFSFFAFIIGLAAAIKLSIVAAHFPGSLSGNSKWLPVISFAIVFIIVVLLVNIGARVIKKAITLVMLGWIDKLGGIILYIIVYTIIFSVLLFFAEKTSLLNQDIILKSSVYNYVAPWGRVVINNLGKIIPLFKDLFGQLQTLFENLGHKLPV